MLNRGEEEKIQEVKRGEEIQSLLLMERSDG